MIDCKRAGQLIEKKEYEKLNWFQKRKLRIHIRVCGLCADYEKDNVVLCKIIKLANIKHSKHCLSQEEKDQLRQTLTENC
ncbi:hypothetical protein K6119_05575 [Paracrocinitomix mangrovi]|uniref:hypothetical protein n=1 Tax=Paracrocinitomix mangrovi TaxID=2862509 RepID=UPI001C8D88BA|nr:hypothetical protein [Paracrocinitomix mangrovi]UKN02983.1 hypothetical protein K6119_05575 [Paracrocinitomix mangrovi]